MRLDDVRVLDLTRLLPGPYATQLLADMGADVVKVEEPEVGDYARMTSDEETGIFQAVNRGKRSVTLDLKADAGREAFYELAAAADVIVEGFRPEVMGRLDLDYASVREHNPGIVYCSLSGFGATGPNRDRVGHDLNYIGMAGLLDMTRPDADAAPVIPGYPIADMAGGLFAAFGVVSALLSRELGDGTGEHVDVAMTDVIISFSQAVAGEAIAGEDPRSGETTLTGELPCYDVYETADGRYMSLAALEPQFFEAFCEAVDRPDLADEHMAPDPADRERVSDELAAIFRERSQAEWDSFLADVDAMVAPVRTPGEVVESEQVAARGLLEAGEAGQRIGFPARPSAGLPEGTETVPGLGEHTEEVLADYAVAPETVEALEAADAT
jgi:alpha-methylacyl-CoA racemase